MSSVVPRSPMSFMAEQLRKHHNATDEELAYLETLQRLRDKSREPIYSEYSSYGYPSVVIDNFLYHGDLGHASNFGLLKQFNIRHIINVCDCELDQQIKDNFNILWINLYDEMQANIKKYFEQTNKFLNECKMKNEKVLVHCQMGISRSSSIVLAYLMRYHHDTLYKAYDYLLERRRMAAPNFSFLLQLIRYENELRANKEIDETKHNDDQQNPIKKIDESQK